MTDRIKLVGAFEARTRLSELLENTGRGHVYRITKRGKPLAEWRAVPAQGPRPTFGADRGRVVVSGDFDAPVDDMT